MVLFKHEMKMNRKSLILWTICVGLMCFGSIMLYTGLEESIAEIADTFSDMGAMSAALGMDKMSLATLRGYYATEIAMMHNLGGAMFAAILGSCFLSKEEEGHTTEFLYVAPVERGGIVLAKYLALVSNIVLLNLVCVGLYVLGFVMMGEGVGGKEMVLYHCAACMMQLEIGTVCFLISAFSKRNRLGVGLGITIALFAADMMCRIVPAIENLKYITPFYYAGAADIFTEGKVNIGMVVTGIGITFLSYLAAHLQYLRKDL